jgi:formylglycine-generating enzyme required for sulfatase activity
MIRIGDYCIDSTEVSQGEYDKFLEAGAGFGPNAAPAGCQWKTTFVPGKVGGKCRWDLGERGDRPVECVDWCDAFAYCRWAGKRLCGAIGGGPVAWAPGEDIDATKDEWYRACAKDGSQAYPYGEDFKPGACNIGDPDAGTVRARDETSQCVGAYEKLYNMVGNVYEWEDSCSGDAGASDLCKERGGSWHVVDTEANKCTGRGAGDRRDGRFNDVGIRCCAD